MKTLTRYKNRKIYDYDINGYVTLPDILGLILEGQKVIVVDKESGADITATTLCHILTDVVVKERNISTNELLAVIISSYKSIDTEDQTNYTN